MSDIETAYNTALDYLYSFVDYSLKHSSELAKADFNLDRMRALMAELGNPHDQYPDHPRGWDKGERFRQCLVCFGLASCRIPGWFIYFASSCWIIVSGSRSMVSPSRTQNWLNWLNKFRPAVAKIPKLTTFEITTALGFLYFAQQKVDAAVFEVGLGGRLDATNVVTPKVSVITSLSYDHMAVLGNTLAQIAGEKAGIIKPGMPVVSAPQKEEALEVLDADCEGKKCALYIDRAGPYL